MARLNPNRDNETEAWLEQLANGGLVDSGNLGSGKQVIVDGQLYHAFPNRGQAGLSTPEIDAYGVQLGDGQWYIPDGPAHQTLMGVQDQYIKQNQGLFDSLGAGILALPAAGFGAAGGFAAMGAGAGAAGAELGGAFPAAAEGSAGLWGPGGAGALEGIGATGLGFTPVEGGMTMAPNFGGMSPMVVGQTPYALPPFDPTSMLMGGAAGGAAGLAGGLAADGITGSTGAAGTAGTAGAAGAAGGLGGAGGAAGTSALASLLGGTAGAADVAKLLGALGGVGLGIAGAQDQTAAMKEMQDKQIAMYREAQQKQLDMSREMSDKYMGLSRENRDLYLGLGAPYRDKLQSSYQPGFDIFQSDPALQGAVDQTSNSLLRRLSTSGNPFDNPGGLMEAQKYVNQNVALPQLNAYRSQLGGFGQLGVNTAGTTSMDAAGIAGRSQQGAANSMGQFDMSAAGAVKPLSNSGVYDALGFGLSSLTQPSQDPMAMMRQMQSMYPLNGWGM
jgi:hypothetical protein